ncbi:hypothetical protein [Streptomyces sp. GC420]|uniref:hypothetical protein n=1 Tax=Streptomyces sp. GC420 TaxID=2697568 RepID=UPI0014150366|nr:hypothetical protein [Streptomyces sp. GC420]NBM20230.1 hypothetical protein [Streptomyces sp. GC420]
MTGSGGAGGGVRWNDETQSWETGEGAGPAAPTPPPPPIPLYEPASAEVSYDLSHPGAAGPPAPGSPGSPGPGGPFGPGRRRTRALIAGAAVAVAAGGLAGGLLALRDDGKAGAGDGSASVSASGGPSDTFDAQGEPSDPAAGTATDPWGPEPGTDSPSGTPSPGEVPEGFVLEEDAEGFTIAVPEDWEREKKDTGVFYNSPDGRSLVQVFTITEAAITPYEALRQASADLARSNDGYEEISLEDLPEENAAELVYAYDSAKTGGRRQVVDRAFDAGDGTQYALLVAGPEDDWPAQRDILTTALDHFVP